MATLTRDILLTGATGAIGGAIAARLAGPDVRLHLAGRSLEKLEALRQQLSGKGPVVVRDAALDSPEQAAAATARFVEEAAQPFGLICTAGNFGASGDFVEVDFPAWQQSFSLNFFSPAAMVQAFARGLKARKLAEGRVALLSGAGVGSSRSFAGATSYSTNKASLTHFVEAVAPELAPLGISINAVAPGAVVSRLTDEIIAAGGNYGREAQALKTSGKGVPPELAADFVALLLGPGAARVTGRLLSARFDREQVEHHAAKVQESPDLFRLRRIDEQLFGKK